VLHSKQVRQVRKQSKKERRGIRKKRTEGKREQETQKNKENRNLECKQFKVCFSNAPSRQILKKIARFIPDSDQDHF